MKNTLRGFIVPLPLVIIALLLVGGGVWLYAAGGPSSGTVTASTSTVTPVAASTTAPNIKSAQISVSIDGPLILYVYGTGFNSSFRVYISGNGLSDFLVPVSKYVSENGSNETSITVVLPSTVDSTKQYNVYVSNGSTTSNTVSTPSQG